ncbi:hypothetical protein PG993_000587 [Apiospora rasikravindrae]|uniref:CHAT domain-containing protein n=1 Tax=Apiospora rasikravindrae TaxID=990691 RepID=A0ABR1U8Z8_9PEZI
MTDQKRHSDSTELVDAPNDNLELSDRLYNIALDQHFKWDESQILTDLNLAIKYYHEAIDGYCALPPQDEDPEEDWDLGSRYFNLGNAYLDKYYETRNIADIEDAIKNHQTAISLTADNYPYRPDRQRSLAEAYSSKYNDWGNIDDLEVSIQIMRDTMNNIADDDSRWTRMTETLAEAHFHRYGYYKAASDLDMAVGLYKKIVEKTSGAAPDGYLHHRDLAGTYLEVYRKTSSVEDLNAAIQTYERAHRMAPTNKPDVQADLLGSLGMAYHNRWRISAKPEDLEAAKQQYEACLKITNEGDKERVCTRTFWLAQLYRENYEVTMDTTNLSIAIPLLHKALDSSRHDDPVRIDKLFELGNAHQFWSDHFYATSELSRSRLEEQKAIEYYREAIDQSSAPMHKMLKPIRAILALYTHTEQWSEAYDIVKTAMSILPLVAPQSLDNSDKQDLLVEWERLPSDAAAVALNAGKTPYEAIRLLELGRGIMIGSSDDVRLDLPNLRYKYPEEAEEYIKLQNQLNALSAPRHRFNERSSVDRQLQEAIRKIRGKPGFDQFLLGPSEDEMKALATAGPIVILNLSSDRCDALVIEETRITAIPLSNVDYTSVQWEHARLQPCSLTTSLLEWLWEAIAEPVLRFLGFTQTPDGSWPHLWWIPTGLLTNMPIHAAGFHRLDSACTVMDRVISSYSTSVKTVFQRRKTVISEKEFPSGAKVALVGTQELLHAPQEVDKLQKTLLDHGLRIIKPKPLWEEVLAALDDCNIFHFAGHGNTDTSDPLKSALVLDDKPLAVADFFGRKRQDRQMFLAYLSACGTGQIRNDKLMDEGLHLITAFQLAGFQHVVGTLWEVSDELCVTVATKTYEWVLQHGLNSKSVSEGLHHATHGLRGQWLFEDALRGRPEQCAVRHHGAQVSLDNLGLDKTNVRAPRDVNFHEDAPLYWVPYVHFGP